jgi:hypothetical protein
MLNADACSVGSYVVVVLTRPWFGFVRQIACYKSKYEQFPNVRHGTGQDRSARSVEKAMDKDAKSDLALCTLCGCTVRLSSRSISVPMYTNHTSQKPEYPYCARCGKTITSSTRLRRLCATQDAEDILTTCWIGQLRNCHWGECCFG